MILGEAGVGKTSLLSLLTGEPFNPNHNKTEGIDTDFVCTSNICSVTWKKKKMEGDEEYKDITAKKLAKILPDINEEQPMQHKKKVNVPSHTVLKEQFDSLVEKYTKQKEPSVPPKPSLPVTTLSIPKPSPTPRTEKNIIPPAHQPPLTTDIDVIHTEIMRQAVKLKKSKSSDGKINIPLKFSSFDFAGQKHYKPMHHCFLTSRAVYVVAFNVRHLLNDQQNKCIQELKFWVNSIHIYTDVTAKIVLVGTHRGPYPGFHGNDHLNPLTSEQEEIICKVMEDNFDKECYASQISWFENDEIDGGIFAMVENSLRGDDSGANAIRNKLLELGDKYPGNNDDLPTSYLRLEQKIFKERKQNTMISHKVVVGWASEFGIDDPTVALTFFHDIGTIIDPSESLSTFIIDQCHTIVFLQVNCPQYLWTKKSCQN